MSKRQSSLVSFLASEGESEDIGVDASPSKEDEEFEEMENRSDDAEVHHLMKLELDNVGSIPNVSELSINDNSRSPWENSGKLAAEKLLAVGVLEGSLKEMYVRMSRISTSSSHTVAMEDTDVDLEALALYEVFNEFSSPKPSFQQLLQIMLHYRQQTDLSRDNVALGASLELPEPAVVLIGTNPCPVVRLLTLRPRDCLMCLPQPFQLAFFHVLIRLLTSEDALHYSAHTIRDMHLPSHADVLPASHTPSNDIIYPLARFCAKPDWHPAATPVTPLLRLLILILAHDPAHHLILPLTRLLGLTSATNMSIAEFRLTLDLIAHKAHPNIVRLYLIKALCTAADTPPPSAPRCFFNFSPLYKPKHCSGIQLALSYWPFKTDFAFIVSFRPETFAPCHESSTSTPSLFKITTVDGAGFEIKFETNLHTTQQNPVDNNTPATIAICIYESQTNRSSRKPKVIHLNSSLLLPRTWHHLAVRHTSAKFKNIFSSTRDELQVFLDNNLVYSEELQFPKIKPRYLQSPPIPTHKLPNSDPPVCPVQISLAESFVGQTTSFHIFKDYISNASLEAFFNHHPLQQQLNQKINDSSFNKNTPTRLPYKSNDTNSTPKDFNDFFVVDEDADNPTIPSELSRTQFGIKLLLTIDPRRVLNQSVMFDPCIGCHVFLENKSAVNICNLINIKDSIISLGGISALLKIVHIILDGDKSIKRNGIKETSTTSRNNGKCNNNGATDPLCSTTIISDIMTQENGIISLIPSIIGLFASFLKNHTINARDMIKCNGIGILEQHLLHNKRLGLSLLTSNVASKTNTEYMMMIVRNSPKLSQLLVYALLDIRAASMHNPTLENQVSSRLLCNVSLWFGEVSNYPGVSLHAALLPVVSAITKSSPDMIEEYVDMKDIIELVNDFIDFNPRGNSSTDDDSSQILSTTVSTERYFERTPQSDIPISTPLTLKERRHVTDILLGIVVTIMSSTAQTQDLQLLLQFIAYNLDSAGVKTNTHDTSSSKSYDASLTTVSERFLTTTKVCTIFLYLLQIRPPMPTLFKSLESCFNDTDGAVTFLLCTMADSNDDFLRSIGIRCVTAFIEVASCTDSATNILRPLGDIKEDSTSAQVSEPDNNNLENPTQAITGAIKYVGTGLFRTTLSNELLSSKANPKVLYRLLWHILKGHRERLGEYTHASLINFLIEDDSYASNASDLILTCDDVLDGGYCLNVNYAKVASTTVGADSNQRFRDVYSVTAILHVLKFLPKDMKRRWLFDLLTLIRIAPESIKGFLPSHDWQPSLFTVAAEVVETMTSKAKEVLWDKNTEEMKLGSHNSLNELVDNISGGDNDNNDVQITKHQNKCTKSKHDSTLNSSVPSVSSNSDEEDFFEDTENLFPKSRSGFLSPDLDLPNQYNENAKKSDYDPLAHSATMFDLSFKLYSILLGHSVRQGGEESFNAIEQAASLQRICLNGDTVIGILLSNLITELTANGTVHDIEKVCPKKMKVSGERHRFLKMSARVVTTAILTNGAEGIDMPSAVRQWRSLRHLTAVSAAVISKCGFDISNLFEFKNDEASAIGISGGLEGIRLSDGSISGVSACEITDDFQFIAETISGNTNRQKYYENYAGNRRVCVTLAAQLLSLLDAFIFPDSLDASLPASQLHGLALVRGIEPRLGKAQGPLLASLVRLSLLLIVHLEPSSIKFLQCCSRLRCFLHWTLELIRESVALGGYSTAFQALTAPLDRLVLSVVLLCHHALSKCSQVLKKIESSTSNKYFTNLETKQKNHRRIFRSSSELREIVLAAYRGRNEVLRAALSPEAYEALQCALEEIVAGRRQQISKKVSREASLRCFISNNWVQDFHGASKHGNIWIPFMVVKGQLSEKYDSASDVGLQAIQDLSDESTRIVDEYECALNAPFEMYCEEQRLWAETDNLVFEYEHKGKSALNKLAQGYRLTHSSDNSKHLHINSDAVSQEWKLCNRRISSFWTAFDTSIMKSSIGDSAIKHWKLAKYADLLHRRVLFVPDRNFKPHKNSTYEILSKEQISLGLAISKLVVKIRRRKISGIVNSMNASGNSVMLFDAQILEELRHMNDSEEFEDDIKENGLSTVIEGTEEENDLPERLPNDFYAWAKEVAWSDGECVVQSFDKVSIVTLQTVSEGELLLTTHSLYFRPYSDTVNIMTRESVKDVTEDGLKFWRLSRLTEVHGRRYILRAQALELHFVDAFQLFINFANGSKIRDRFYHKLRNNCKVPILNSPKSLNPRVIIKKSKITELWRKRKISNFQYIMQLNIIAGRTYNDITQYPVFPWILADYTSSKLDLNDPKTFRDLSKPVGALNPDRLEQLLERYDDFDCFPEEEKFLYGSHYSSPGVVLHYMIRQEPFTTMAIQLQSGRFDCPDRLFFDLGGCWNSCLKSTSDVKELTPEFFTCPEIFINTNNYDLGETQTKIKINDVILPPWANKSPYEFVRLHMLALESEHVSKNLHHWIDLIFGFKQRGPEALKAFNLFHHLSYEGTVDLEKITNEVDRKATESHIQNFGQTPSQLLPKDPHPVRLSIEECWSPLLNEPSLLQHLQCYTPPKQFGGGANSDATGAVLSIHAFTDTIAVVYADMSIGTYKCSYNRNSSCQYQFKNDKLRILGCRSISLSPPAICANPLLSSDIPYSPMLPTNLRIHDDKMKNNDLVGSWCFAGTSRRNSMGGVASRALETTSASVITSNKDISSSVLISCGYYDNTVKVHTLDGLRLKCSDNGGHNGPINCLSIGDDGGIMITGGQDCTCRVWVVRHPEMAAALSDGQCSVQEHLLSCISILRGHESPISCVVFNSDLDINLSGSVDGVICIHTIRHCRFIRAIHAEERDSSPEELGVAQKSPAIKRIALDSSGILVAYREDYMLLAFTVNGKKICSANAGEVLNCVQISTGGQMLITGGHNCHVVIRTLYNLAVCCVLDVTVHGPIRCITLATPDFNPLTEIMYIGTEDGRVTVVDRDKLLSNDVEYDGLPLWRYHDGSSNDNHNTSNNWWNI